jgi:hypothetical protein
LNLPQLQNFRSVVPNAWNKLLSQGMNAKDPHTKEWVWNLLAYAKDAAKGSAVPASILIGAYQLSTSIDRLRESLHQSVDQIKGPGWCLQLVRSFVLHHLLHRLCRFGRITKHKHFVYHFNCVDRESFASVALCGNEVHTPPMTNAKSMADGGILQ